MKTKRLFFSAVLVLLVFVVALTGCSKNAGSGNTGSKGSASGQDASSGKVSLRVIAITHSWTKDLNEIPMFNKLAEEIGVKIEWEQVRSGWDEKKNTILASGDVPDAFIGWGINDSDISTFSNVFMPLNDLIEKHAPNIKRMFEEQPDVKALATANDGNIYGLPSVIPHRPNSFNIHSINRVWLDELGLETPTTFDEFYNVLKAFKEQDPNKNNKQDEIPFDWAPDRGLFTAMSMIGAYGNYAEDFSGDWTAAKDGKFVFLPATEDFKKLVSYLHKLYREGLINQEVFTQDYSQFQAKSKDPEYEIVGSTMGWSLEDRFGPVYAKDYEVLLPLTAEKGIKPVWPAHPARTKYLSNVAQITTKNKNPEITMKWLDGFYTEEMSAQGYYGSLGVCLEKQGDKYIVLPPQDGMGADEWKWTNALVDAGLMYVSPDLDKRIVPPASIAERVAHDALYEPYFPDSDDILPILKFSKDDMSELSIIKTDILKMVDIKWAQWIIEGNVNEEWESYLNQLESMGLSRMSEIYQKYLDEYHGKK